MTESFGCGRMRRQSTSRLSKMGASRGEETGDAERKGQHDVGYELELELELEQIGSYLNIDRKEVEGSVV